MKTDNVIDKAAFEAVSMQLLHATAILRMIADTVPRERALDEKAYCSEGHALAAGMAYGFVAMQDLRKADRLEWTMKEPAK